MEYIYSALLLHTLKKDVSEETLAGVLKSAGTSPDSTRIKGLIAALKDVNIDEAIEKAAMPMAVAQAAGTEAKASEADEAKEKEDAAKSEEAAAEGLSSLFG